MSAEQQERETQDQQTVQQMEELRKEAENLPGVGSKITMAEFCKEFEAGSVFEKKLKDLETNKTFKMIRRTRRDGNCFYRSFLFGLFKALGGCSKKVNSKIMEKLNSALKYTEDAGYEKFAVEDMHEETIDQAKKITATDDSTQQAANIKAIESQFLEDDMNYPICFLRCLTSSYLKTNRALYEAFLELHPTIDVFCTQEVDPMWKEADQLQIQALTAYFGVKCSIFYLDQSSGEVCNEHKVCESGDIDAEYTINLLYRPGHYEVLEKA